jgi:hypothetical protein
MANEKYKIFISSGMKEFKSEREEIKQKLGTLFSTFVYEEDAGARSQTIRETFTEELLKCDLYIGIFGVGYGQYTEEEFESATERNMDRLIYEKKLVDEKRDEKLSAFFDKISHVDDGLTISRFSNADELIRNIERDVGKWLKTRDRVETPGSENPKLALEKKYYCNRDLQSIDFIDIDNKNSDKFNYFIVDGAKKQSHQSLIKRFSIEKTSGDYVKRPITISDKGSLQRLKVYIQMQLFEKFDITPLPSNLTFKTLVKSISAEKYEKVFVVFRIEENLLGNKDVTEAIKWFSSEYCDKQCLSPDSPDFYFFLIIRYNETGSSRKRAIQKHLKKFNGYSKLDELNDVGPDDFIKWVEDYGIADTEGVQENIVEHYFNDDT